LLDQLAVLFYKLLLATIRRRLHLSLVANAAFLSGLHCRYRLYLYVETSFEEEGEWLAHSFVLLFQALELRMEHPSLVSGSVQWVSFDLIC
jgi:hypothetical protein